MGTVVSDPSFITKAFVVHYKNVFKGHKTIVSDADIEEFVSIMPQLIRKSLNAQTMTWTLMKKPQAFLDKQKENLQGLMALQLYFNSNSVRY